MSRNYRGWRRLPLALVVVSAIALAPAAAPSAQTPASTQKIDAEYTALIKQHLTDPRISTELVDHLPASDKVPTPLKFPAVGHISGMPGVLTYAKDIHAYMKAVADAAPTRAKFWVIGQTEEGRDQIVLAISSEETIKNLDRYKGYLQALTDPRRTTEAQARQIIARAKPIYWLTSGVHSTERGGPEMLMELAYRLVVEETPFIQQIRNNVITFITPVVEVDGRERIVDTAYYNAKRAAEGLQGTLGLPYWGKYVAHDNNRDGMGQFLAMTKNVMKVANEWKPTILHDLHEAQSLLYASTGTGPYNEQLDPITIDEWWMFAQNDVMEMTKRGVPGVWTYGFYDGWTPNYMFYAVHTHNATGRFYEVDSYGVNNVTSRGDGLGRRRRPRGGRRGGGGVAVAARGGAARRCGAAARRRRRRPAAAAAQARRVGGGGGRGRGNSREWFRPNPDPGDVNWGPRAHVNMSQSAVLFALSFTGKDKERWLENYWIKNRNAVDKGKNGPTFGWVIPADAAQQGQRRRSGERPDGAGRRVPHRDDGVHRRQRRREAGRLDHPRRSAVPHGRRHVLRGAGLLDVEPEPVRRPRLDVSDDAQPDHDAGDRQGAADGGDDAGDRPGARARRRHRHGLDDRRRAHRRQPARAVPLPVRDGEDVGGRSGVRSGRPEVRAGRVHHSERESRAARAGAARASGCPAFAVASVPADLKQHDLDVPRIGYIHSWGNTQDEGWVRAALDYYKIPYTYFGENEVVEAGSARAVRRDPLAARRRRRPGSADDRHAGAVQEDARSSRRSAIPDRRPRTRAAGSASRG